MTRATELSEAILARLEAITPANGFATEVKRVYGFGAVAAEKAPTPHLLVRIVEDEIASMSGSVAERIATYEVEAVMPRATALQDLQRLHHDVMVTLGTGQLPHVRLLKSGWPFEESVVFESGLAGSAFSSFRSTITVKYVERY